MSEYIYLGDGIVVDDEGEIIESGSGDVLAVIASRRADAKAQAQRWKDVVRDYDRVLLRKQGTRRQAYGDVVITVGHGSYHQTDAEAFADWVAELPLEFGDIIQTIAASKGFDRAALPESVRAAFDATTTELQKRPWIESRVAERVAPVFERGPALEDDDDAV